MVEHIGYPSELLEMSKLEDLYAGLELSPNAYLGNALNMTVFGTNYAFSKLREKVNKTDWVRHGRPAVVNAFYSPLENSIQFPAGILQGIFFSSDRPKYMNYGAIGWVIGHEITHGQFLRHYANTLCSSGFLLSFKVSCNNSCFRV